MDLFRSPSKIDNIGSKLTLPPDWTLGENGETNSAYVAPLFIVNVQIPEELATTLLSMFDNISDGKGFSIVYYYRLTRASAEGLKDIGTASHGLCAFEVLNIRSLTHSLTRNLSLFDPHTNQALSQL